MELLLRYLTRKLEFVSYIFSMIAVVMITKSYPNFNHLSFGHIERKRQLLFIAVKHNKHITKMETFDYKQKSMTKLC